MKKDSTIKSKFYVKIDSISLTRQYDGLAQDSIKTVIELIMQNRIPEVVDTINIDKEAPRKLKPIKKLDEKNS